MNQKLSIYECDDVIKAVEARAAISDGELSEEDLQAIVNAQTESKEKLEKLANYIKHLDGFSELARCEIQQLQAKKKVAENRIAGIKRYLLPYLRAHGPITTGLRRLSTRKSTGVVLADGFDNELYGELIKEFKPNKKAIKASIQAGIDVPGAVLESRVSVQIK